MLRIEGLSKSYAADVVLREVSLELASKASLAVLGQPGSGKTTLLKCIAGLVTPDAGTIQIGDERIDGLPPEKRSIVYLSQEPMLFPHLDVFENLAFGARLKPHDEAALRREVDSMVAALGLRAQERKNVDVLSSGQRQRVAFGRALLAKPRLLLLDEPFGALDGETRATIQVLFRRLVVQHAASTVFVTQDIKEAILIGDRLGFLRDASLTTYGSRDAFLADERIGAMDEVRFWAGLK